MINLLEESQLVHLPHNCKLKLQAVYANLKNAECKAADYLIANTNAVKNMTIAEFSRRAGCSEATVVRLSKRLGYEGYPELKADIEAGSPGDSPVEYNDVTPGDDPFEVVRKVFDSTLTAVQDTLAVIDREAYKKTFQAIVDAGTVMYCGVGDAGIVALEAYQKSIRVGQKTFFSADPDLQLIMASQLGKSDLLIAISHSGKSTSVINTVKAAKAAGAVTAAITNFPISPLTKQVDIVLQTAVFSKSLSGEVVSKRITELCIIESLYINYLLFRGKPSTDTLLRSNKVVEINKS
jgi:RpiR family transcriptional regulator, carbohydrate utilization regulator